VVYMDSFMTSSMPRGAVRELVPVVTNEPLLTHVAQPAATLLRAVVLAQVAILLSRRP